MLRLEFFQSRFSDGGSSVNWFKRSMVVGALVAVSSFSSCQPPAQPSSRASGSLALSADDSTVFAVDTDNGVLAVINPATSDVRQVKVGKDPVRVIVSADDTAFVANRGERSVSVVRKGDTTESARIPVGVEPTGLALTPDGKTLLVTSSTSLTRTDTGLLTAIDVGTLEKKWEIEVGEEPRAVATIKGNRAMVSLYKQGEMVEVDLEKAQVVSSKTGIYETANATRVSGGSTGFGAVSTFQPRAMADLVATPEGDRVFAPVVWAREDSIGRRPSSSGGYYSAGGPCNIGAVATAGIVTVDTGATPTPQVDDLTGCFSAGTNSAAKDFPASTLASNDPTVDAIQGPTVGVLDPTGSMLLVLSRESRNLAFMPAWKRSAPGVNFDSTGTAIQKVTSITGHGADGLAVTRDFKRAYVYSQFDHRLEVFESSGQDANLVILPKGTIQVAGDVIADRGLIEGRKLFFDAKDTRMSSSSTVVACSTCHLEGREDGHVWQFPDGPRQTPALAGRKLLSTAPYHWSGEFPSLNEFNVHTITERMGGRGLDLTTAQKLDAYIDQLPGAENALRTSLAGTAAEARGQAAFQKAGCDTCHSGAIFTDNSSANVGTLKKGITNPDNGIVEQQGFNVPSLLGIGRSAPYLHDGSQLSLAERVLSNTGDLHGKTSLLTSDEKTDLVEYLKSL